MDLMGNALEDREPGAALHWHALYTRHQHEKPIARILSSKGHEVFLPLYAATRQWQDRTKQLYLPLFPCYMFLRGGLDRQLQVLSTPGVFTVVGWAGHPAIIPDCQIERVRQLRSGTLQGLEGILVRKKSLFRLVISLEILGRSAAVEIDFACLERLGPSPIL